MQITKATIRYPQGSVMERFISGDTQAVVTATFEDGTQKEVLRFYSDELSFSPNEFVGLTEEGVRALFHRKDVAYLRS